MKTCLVVLLATLVCGFAIAEEPVGKRVWSEPAFHLYAVFIGIVIDAESKLQSFRIAGVTEPKVDPKKLLDVTLPEKYVATVRQRMSDGKREPTLEDGKPVERFAFFYFSPQHPGTVITDLSLPLERQP